MLHFGFSGSTVVQAAYTLALTHSGETLLLSIVPDDPSGSAVWPDDSRWTVFNLSGLTQPAGTTVEDTAEIESPAMASVTLNSIDQTAYEDMLSQITVLPGSSPFNSTGDSSSQEKEDVFMATQGTTMLIVALEMDAASDEITIMAMKY